MVGGTEAGQALYNTFMTSQRVGTVVKRLGLSGCDILLARASKAHLDVSDCHSKAIKVCSNNVVHMHSALGSDRQARELYTA